MTGTIIPPTRDVLVDCVRTATAAPSLHNSQPWQFRIRGSRIEVYADPARRLRVLDPDGREQLISLGAALFTLRLAIRRSGHRSDYEVFPDADRPDLVARIRATCPSPVLPAVEALAAAIPHRHTNRWPFARTAVPAAVLDHLRHAAGREGALLASTGPAGRDALLRLARHADQQIQKQPGYREECAHWSGSSSRPDGVPPWAIGPPDAYEMLPIRDFIESAATRPRPSDRFEPNPSVLVLATQNDRRVDWVRAGQALQRVLLTATWHGLATMPISQPIELPSVRRLLIEPTSGLSAQMLLRVGYGRTIGRTPRRPLAEVLLPTGRRTQNYR
ncbi:Acg family FMN-binding oxidoreductase [Paractinoplanes hotanensis]|uniref:Nitroreductase family protein n=1 Tax=Paractinoplanes hotanensis TaxID=2906497 RepID=A0ABT0YGH9_9ACTN|nr:nitroreductase family protein [Actinoplanes hotanensis]MCM4085171.1 nitroreductase family protein [Actinoplanes hotanensis]